MAGKQPISVDALLQKQKEAGLIKPKFMTKAERQRLAQEKEEAERKEQELKAEKDKKEREAFEAQARAARAREQSSSGRGGPSDGRDGRYPRQDWRGGDSRGPPPPGGPRGHDSRNGHYPTGPRADRGQAGGNGYYDRDAPRAQQNGAYASGSDPHRQAANGHGPHGTAPSTSNGNGVATSGASVTEAEQEIIRQRYLGLQTKSRKKTRRELNEKQNMFGWDTNDDTSDRVNPVYEATVSAAPLGQSARDDLDRPRRGKGVAGVEKHWTEKKLEEMTERDWRIFREDFAISAKGGQIPRPLRSWRESTIPASILEAIDEIGYKEPSPIQRGAIPIGLQNRDLIGIAETGSGKTASFVIPMLSYISDLPRLTEETRHLGPYALIMAPTRELAQQIEVETQKFANVLGFRCVSIVGGRDLNEQAFNMRDGAEIVIATPGRLKDCIERHIIVLGQCTYVVMDEADRMVNLGFEEVVNFILDSLPVSNLKPDTEDAEDPLKLLRKEGEERTEKYRVTMLYSATMPVSVERMARKYLRRPATIIIGDAGKAVGTVEQNVEFINSEDKKKARLLQILNSGFEPPIIVFVNQKKTADMVGRDLQRAGWNTAILHSGKSQEQREAALVSLRSGECPILVATDLAGRGIDVPDVSLVINFQMSNHIEAYIHRIGRTGRAGKRGTAITFLDGGDEELFYDLKQEISKSPISTLSNELSRHPAAQSRMMRDSMKRKRNEEEG